MTMQEIRESRRQMLERAIAKQAECKASARSLSAMIAGTRREWLLAAAGWGAQAVTLRRRLAKMEAPHAATVLAGSAA